jgi:hypothetical protein
MRTMRYFTLDLLSGFFAVRSTGSQIGTLDYSDFFQKVSHSEFSSINVRLHDAPSPRKTVVLAFDGASAGRSRDLWEISMGVNTT